MDNFLLEFEQSIYLDDSRWCELHSLNFSTLKWKHLSVCCRSENVSFHHLWSVIPTVWNHKKQQRKEKLSNWTMRVSCLRMFQIARPVFFLCLFRKIHSNRNLILIVKRHFQSRNKLVIASNQKLRFSESVIQIICGLFQFPHFNFFWKSIYESLCKMIFYVINCIKTCQRD